MKNLFRRCYDCQKYIYPWQLMGLDFASHKECHKRRIRELLNERPELIAYLPLGYDIKEKPKHWINRQM